jgi:hypothetical protein
MTLAYCATAENFCPYKAIFWAISFAGAVSKISIPALQNKEIPILNTFCELIRNFRQGSKA